MKIEIINTPIPISLKIELTVKEAYDVLHALGKVEKSKLTSDQMSILCQIQNRLAYDCSNMITTYEGIVDSYRVVNPEWYEYPKLRHNHGITPLGMNRSDCPACVENERLKRNYI